MFRIYTLQPGFVDTQLGDAIFNDVHILAVPRQVMTGPWSLPCCPALARLNAAATSNHLTRRHRPPVHAAERWFKRGAVWTGNTYQKHEKAMMAFQVGGAIATAKDVFPMRAATVVKVYAIQEVYHGCYDLNFGAEGADDEIEYHVIGEFIKKDGDNEAIVFVEGDKVTSCGNIVLGPLRPERGEEYTGGDEGMLCGTRKLSIKTKFGRKGACGVFSLLSLLLHPLRRSGNASIAVSFDLFGCRPDRLSIHRSPR